MGIKNLNSILKQIDNFPKKNIKNLKLSIIAVDFSLFLYRFIYNRNNPVECFLRQLSLFFKNNILPVYVLDGTAPEEKKDVLNKRAEKRDRNLDEIEKLNNLKLNTTDSEQLDALSEEIQKLEKRCVQIHHELYDDVLTLFDLCGVPVIQENCESDWILAKLSENKLVDLILSEDSDILVFGGSNLMKKFSIIEETTLIYDLNVILKKLKLTREQFVDMCILCGCDYTPKIKNMNCCKSYELISQFKNIENIENYNINLENIQQARNIFNKKISEELLSELSKKILKKNFQFDKIEKFLNENIEKKFLITQFLYNCRQFCYYKKYNLYK